MTIKPSDDLNLPDAPDFISKPPTYTAAEMVAICEKMLSYWNAARAKNLPPPFQGDAFTLDLLFSYLPKATD
jgi:hypothetical protein